MTKPSYRGSLLLELQLLIENRPDYTVAEILHSFLRPRMLKKLLLECSDEDLFIAIERAKESFEEQDELPTDVEFQQWVDKY